MRGNGLKRTYSLWHVINCFKNNKGFVVEKKELSVILGKVFLCVLSCVKEAISRLVIVTVVTETPRPTCRPRTPSRIGWICCSLLWACYARVWYYQTEGKARPALERRAVLKRLGSPDGEKSCCWLPHATRHGHKWCRDTLLQMSPERLKLHGASAFRTGSRTDRKFLRSCLHTHRSAAKETGLNPWHRSHT